MRTLKKLTILAVLLLLVGASPAFATEYVYTIVIENHQFSPAELIVPVGQKIQLVIENRDGSAEEFESEALKREKLVGGGKSVTILIGPLAAGKYEFMGEFHKDTAKGTIVAAEEYQADGE